MTRTKALLLCGAASLAALPAAAQTSSTSAGNLTTATPTATTSTTSSTTAVRRKPPTSATPEMVNEAIQRSEARAAKAQASGTTERWGTEEPFAYNPAVRRFNPDQQ